MRDQRRYFGYLLFILILSTVLVGLTWVNFRYSLQNSGGSDFLPRWLGTRQFRLTGQSPYSDQTSEQIQQQFYGRAAHPDEDQVLFVYPFYSIFILAPFSLIPDYNIARAVWMTALEIAVLGIALIGVRLSRWKPGPLGLGFLMLFALLYYYDLRALINANASILIALFVFAAFLAVRAGEDAWAGFLLALATIKPQMVVLLLVFIIIWSISNCRNLIIWSLFGNLALMIAISSLLIPDWIWQMLRQVIANPGYPLPNTPRAIFMEWLPGVGEQLGWALLILVATMLIWEWQLARREGFSLVFLDRKSDTRRYMFNRNSNRNRELYNLTALSSARIFWIYPGMGDIWAILDRAQLNIAFIRNLVAVSGDLTGGRSAGSKPIIVLLAASLSNLRSLRGSLADPAPRQAAF